jgi:hypothetical protein
MVDLVPAKELLSALTAAGVPVNLQAESVLNPNLLVGIAQGANQAIVRLNSLSPTFPALAVTLSQLASVTVNNTPLPITQATQEADLFAADSSTTLETKVNAFNDGANLESLLVHPVGSQHLDLKQRAVTAELEVQLSSAGAEYDARQIRALTATDVVDVSDRTTRQLGIARTLNAGFFDGLGSVLPISFAFDVIIKSALAITNATAGSRALLISTKRVSSNTVAASTTGDLLNREVSVVANTLIDMAAKQNPDELTLTYTRISN